MRLLSLSLLFFGLISTGVLAEAPVPPTSEAPAPEALPSLEELDALYLRRSEPEVAKSLEAALQKSLAQSPHDFEIVWRLARLVQWKADGIEKDMPLKEKLGKEAWNLAKHAAALSPQRAEGYYYAAAGIGAYSQARGVVNALLEGLEGQFVKNLEEAIKLNPTHERGAPLLVMGRYHYEMPWPKRDLRKSAELYQKVIAKHPENLRAYYFLAETLLEEGKAQEAKAAIMKVVNGNVGYDPAEGRRVQKWSKEVLAKIEEKLK